MALTAWISGIGAWSPAFASWPSARDRLAGAAAGPAAPLSAPASSLPAPDAAAGAPVADSKPPPAHWLPPNERRRATLGTRLVLSVAQEALTQAGWDAAQVPSVFASSSGSPEITDDLCSMLAAGDTQISPTKFHNSVHNAAAGYYSIAVACRRASTSIGAFDASAATGLLEALAQLASAPADDARMLFVSFDLPYTGPLAAVRPVHEAWGVAFALSGAPQASSIARIDLDWRGPAPAQDVPAQDVPAPASARMRDTVADAADAGSTRCADAALESVRLRNPTARLLPLLQALSVPRRAHVVLAAGGASVALDVFPR